MNDDAHAERKQYGDVPSFLRGDRDYGSLVRNYALIHGHDPDSDLVFSVWRLSERLPVVSDLDIAAQRMMEAL